jgi:uncharacterized membrane protein (UPF0127 family)
MQVLNFPFNKSIKVQIVNDAVVNQLDCELANSDLEIFQSLNYRKEKHFSKPLALLFSNPLAKSFSKQAFDFPVEKIEVDYKNNTVKSIETIYPNKNKTNNNTLDSFTAYSNCSLVILAPKGLTNAKNIRVAKTSIKL